jgi:glycerophosphoryl diester phosphodiesterase
MNGVLSAHHVEEMFHHLVNRLCRRWPRPVSRPHRIHACRIISHRGEHDNHTCFENTLAAFDKAADAGVWGIELDIRWTRDLVPVVFHDADTLRLFNEAARIRHMTASELKERFPLIPAFSEVVERYGRRRHLMIEIKTEPYPRPSVQIRRMQRLLRHLSPGRDFHLMGLDPGMFTYFDFLPAAAFIPIARVRIDRFSRLAAAHGWGGVAGHYLLATRGLINRHHGLGQRIGTGFADSRNCLYREVSRGVDWIFSNRALAMQAICHRLQA